jgi:acyl dehydratase
VRSLSLGELGIGDAETLTKTITDADVVLFAGISGDFNPLHVDAVFAARSGFGARVAHGTLTMGIAAGVLGTMLPGVGTVALSVTTDFHAPVLVGDTVTARVEVAAIDPERGRATMALTWTNQRGELVASGEAIVRPPRVACRTGRSNTTAPTPAGVAWASPAPTFRRSEMAQLAGKRFDSPDEVREFTEGKGRVELVDLNGHAVGLGTFEPGWQWSKNVKPLAGTDSCQVEHIGFVLEGRMALRMDDGTEREFGPGDAFHMPPGHDAWIVGDETCKLLDFGGLKGYAQTS